MPQREKIIGGNLIYFKQKMKAMHSNDMSKELTSWD